MTSTDQSNTSAPSTTTAWKYVRMPAARREAIGTSGAKRRPSIGHRNRRRPVTVVARYRGGPECWIEVQARGRIWRFPGHTALLDAMRAVWGESRWKSSPVGDAEDAGGGAQ